MRKLQFTDQHIYHVFNRGVEKRNIYESDEDRSYFVHQLFALNDNTHAANTRYHLQKLTESKSPHRSRNLLVKILAFALLKNHYHLLMQQLVEKGIAKFMHKLGTGFANYFNLKYKRDGSLFQGRFKAVEIVSDEQLYHMFFYIHAANPLDIITPGWRENGIGNYEETTNQVRAYRWSSLPDYTGRKNFPSVTHRDFLTQFLGGQRRIESELSMWIQARERNLKQIRSLSLE